MMQKVIAALAVLLTACSVASAENWTMWRGPNQNGVSPTGSYPTQWSETENIAWSVALPGRGGSTPIIWGERIFVTSETDRNEVSSVDTSGKLLWTTTIGDGRGAKHQKATGANPSPVTDGEAVYAYFKSGDLAAVDFDGKVLWKHNLQQEITEDTLWWDLGTSPVVTKDFVIVAVMQSGPSYLAAFDKASGKLAWKQDRILDAPEESSQSYSTPVLVHDGERELLVVLGADHVTCHEAATGKELWRVGGLNPTGHKYFRSIASPVVTDGMVVAPYGRGATIFGIRMGGAGDVTASHVAWVQEGFSPDVPTPAAADGRAYVVTDKGEVYCLEAASGKILWHHQLEKNRNSYSASPVLAGGNLYLTREDGVTFVIKASDKFELVAQNELDGRTVATPVPLDGRIYFRTYEKLYCIGK